jgi:hypothetical protein
VPHFVQKALLAEPGFETVLAGDSEDAPPAMRRTNPIAALPRKTPMAITMAITASTTNSGNPIERSIISSPV